jgi:FkbM family methyltransferase
MKLRVLEKIRSRLIYVGAYRFAPHWIGKLRVFVASMLIQVPKTIRNRIHFIDDLASWFLRGVKMNGLGAQFYIDALNNLKHIQDFYEEEIQDWFFIQPDEQFIDIGANIGRYTVTLAKKCREVYAFEPFPKTYDYLVRNIELNELRNVRTFPVAIWNKVEIVKFHVKKSSGINSIVEPENAITEIEVTALPLDYFSFIKIGLIKIDVEGAEVEVLKGMTENLKIYRPRVIVESKKNNVEWIMNYFTELDYLLVDNDEKETYENLFFCPLAPGELNE